MLYLTPVFAMLYLIPIIVMLYLIPIFAMLYLTCDIWHRYSVFTPVLGIYSSTQYLHRHLACYTWYVIYDSGTWYLHRHSIYRPGTWYVILDTCTWHTVYDMLSCGTNTWTWHLDPWPDITTPDTCIYMTYSWLSLLRGLGMTIILLPDIWYSWTLVLLYPWTPEIGRLLTLLLILYSCWPP